MRMHMPAWIASDRHTSKEMTMNALDRTSQLLIRTRRGLAVALFGVASAAPMLAAAPAFADHASVQVAVSNGCFSFGLRSGPPVACRPVDNWATREFERGQCAGRNDGQNEGFSDGLRDCF